MPEDGCSSTLSLRDAQSGKLRWICTSGNDMFCNGMFCDAASQTITPNASAAKQVDGKTYEQLANLDLLQGEEEKESKSSGGI